MTSEQLEILENLHELSGANPRHPFDLAEIESWGFPRGDVIAVVQDLSAAGYIRLANVSSDGVPAAVFITRTGIQAVEMSGSAHADEGESPSSVLIFVCHSSDDADVAASIIDLIQSAFRLTSREIRCTSVDGYKLPAGATTDERLRTEVHDSSAFIGIISAHSLRSAYVLFELGARWGAKKRMVPLLAKGAAPSILSGPLSGLNVLNCASTGELYQLVREVGEAIGQQPDNPDAYQRHIDVLRTRFGGRVVEREDVLVDDSSAISEDSLNSFVSRVFPDLPVARDNQQLALVTKHINELPYLDYKTVSDLEAALERTSTIRRSLAETSKPRSGLDNIVRAMAAQNPDYISVAFPGKSSRFIDILRGL